MDENLILHAGCVIVRLLIHSSAEDFRAELSGLRKIACLPLSVSISIRTVHREPGDFVFLI